jgi:hypothetical protein
MYYLQLLPVAYWGGVVPPLALIFVGTTTIAYLPPVTPVTLVTL